MATEALMQTPEMQANTLARADEFVAIKSLRTGEVVRWDAGGVPIDHLPNSWLKMQFCCYPPTPGLATSTTIQLAEQLLCSATLFTPEPAEPDLYAKL